jgi:uncharacterized membrane protein
MKCPCPQAINDRKVEQWIGNLLRVGVLLAAGVVLLGGVIFLVHNGNVQPNYRVFRGESGDLENVPGIVRNALDLRGRGIIQLGLLLLIATPIARVAFAAVAFALEKDRLYVYATLMVLAILVISLSGHAG